MSRKQKIKHMTPEELKSKLYSHFEKRGALDHLKAQLRGQLVSELFKVADNIDSNSFPNAADVEKCLLPLQVCNWLIYDHLSRQDYQYSLSTFVTEAHLPNPEKLLTAGDILGLIGLGPNSVEFHNISKLYGENNELGCLNSLLLSIMKVLFNIPNKDSILNQSIEMDDPGGKEAKIDHKDSVNAFVNNKRVSCDTSFQSNFFKSKHMSVDKSFLANNDIQSTETSFHEQLQSVKKENEKEVQKLRHKLLEELETLHAQEHKMQIEMELEKSELRREQSKLINEREMLKEKEILMEKEISNKFEQKIREINSDFASKLYFKDKEIETIKAKLLEKKQRLTQVEAELSNQKDMYDLIKRELDDLRHMYKIIQDKYASVLDENTNLLQKFEGLDDYSILKDELSAKTKEVLKLQNEIRDIHEKSEIERRNYVETVRNLEDDLNTKEPQLRKTQRELGLVRNTLSSQEAIWNREKRKLEQELSEFKELYKAVIQRIEEQKDDIQDLNRTIHILNYKVNSNTTSISKPESFKSYKDFQRTAEVSLKNKPEALFTKRNSIPRYTAEKYKDTSLKFISDAKNRIGKLKQELDTVQENYSFIFSALPETKQAESTYFENFSSIHKSNFENYELPSLKDMPSGFSFGNYSVDKINNSKSPYSLNNVKRIVSRTLFPSVNVNNNNFHKGVSHLDVYSKEQGTTNRMFKEILKESDTYARQSFVNKTKVVSSIHVNKSMPLDNTKSTESQEIISDKEQNNETVSNPLNELEERSSIQRKQAQATSSPNSPDKNNVCISSNITKHSSQEIKELGMNTIDKNSALQKEILTSAKDAVPTKELPAVSNKSKSVENSELSSKFSVNLDAAWKQRTSALPPFQTITKTVLSEKMKNASELKHSDNIQFQNKEHGFKSKDAGNHELKDTESTSYAYEVNKSIDAHELEEKGSNSAPQSSTTLNKIFSSEHGNSFNKDNEVEISKADNAPTASNSTVETPEQKIHTFKVQSKVNNPVTKEDFQQCASSDINKFNDMKETSAKEENFVKSTEKIASADSLSELSEIHLSCGSETEQQKEDSDAW